jgi:hypothetical protein
LWSPFSLLICATLLINGQTGSLRRIDVWGYNNLAQGADYSLTESAFSPFQAELTQAEFEGDISSSTIGASDIALLR